MNPLRIPLFEVDFKVQPTEQHPHFEHYKVGVLHFWLFADDEFEAKEISKLIANCLPYQLGAGKSYPIDDQPNLADWQVENAVKATHTGLIVAFSSYATEEEFSAVWGQHWPFLVPPISIG